MPDLPPFPTHDWTGPEFYDLTAGDAPMKGRDTCGPAQFSLSRGLATTEVRGTDGVDVDAIVPIAETEEVAHMLADDEVQRALDVQTHATDHDLRDVPAEEMELLPFADKQADPHFRQAFERVIDGVTFTGRVTDIHVDKLTRSRLYRLSYDDGDLEDLTQKDLIVLTLIDQ